MPPWRFFIVFVVPYGDWEIRQFIEKGLKNECFLHTRKILEEMRLAIEEKKAEGVTQFVVILDSAGLTFWKVAHLESKIYEMEFERINLIPLCTVLAVNTILTFFKEFEAYYPELLYRCYIINGNDKCEHVFQNIWKLVVYSSCAAPWVFSYIFNIVKPLMSMRTLGKVTIYDHGARWRKVLNEDLPSDSLPVEYNRIEIPVAP